MTKTEFVKAATKSGYASKKIAESYVKTHPQDEYTDNDLISVYRYAENQSSKHTRPGLIPAAYTNGKTTAFSYGIRGNSSTHQDWV